jgi:hypothetical protein
MATIYTLSDGVQMRLADGLSDEQVLAESNRLANNTLFNTKDIEDTYNITSGVQDYDLRLSLGLADGNQEETTLVLNNKVGKGNWGYTDQGFLYVTPEGLARRGIQSDKPVLVNGTDTTINDLTDVIPEAIVGVGALGAELLLPVVPGSGVLARGFLSPLVSRGLRASSLRAGAGDVAANIGLEEWQKAKGENVETAEEIYTNAGIEGAVVTAASVALGLPFKLTGKLGGKLSQAAKNKMGDTTTNGIAVTSNTAQEARASAVEALTATGKYTAKEVEDLVPVITIKHMLGDEGSLSGKFATILEGIGAKNIGDKLPADALVFLQKFDDLYRNAQIKGMSPVEIVDLMKNSLTKKELSLLGKTQKEIDNFYNNVGAKANSELDVSQITDLITKNIQRQYVYGKGKFDDMYGELNLEGLTEKTVSKQSVVNLVNQIAKAQEGSVEEALSTIVKANNGIGNRINNIVEVRNGVLGIKRIKATENVKGEITKASAKRARDRQAEFNELNNINAKDLLDLSRSFRRQMGNNIDSNTMRLGVNADKTIIDTLDQVAGKEFGTNLAEVNAAYKKFITPFTKRSIYRNLENTSKQNPETFVKQIMTGDKKRLFTQLVDDLDQVLKGTDEIGGKSVDVKNADELLATVGVQYMRYTKQRFNLNNADLTVENLPQIRSNAKQALKMLDDLETKGETTSKYKKAFRKVFNNEGFDEYKKALKQIADGNPEGLGRLQQALSYKEAEQFIERVSKLGDNLTEGGLPNALREFRSYKQIDPDGAKFYNDLLYSQIYSRLLKTGGLDASRKNGAIKSWAEDIVTANNTNKEALEELLGENYKPIMEMGNIIQGAFNIDPTAGAISAAGLPIGAIRGALNMSIVGALKPVSLMYTLKSFAPGQAGWKSINKFAKGEASPEKIDSAMRPFMKKTLGAAKSSANFTMAGRNGLLAATVSAYMNEADTFLPPIDSPNVKRSQIEETQVVEQEVPDQAVAQQQLGQNMMALLQSAQGAVPPAPVSTQNSVNRGAQIANQNQAVSGNPMDTAIPVSITANSIPNSFANLMGSINVSKG